MWCSGQLAACSGGPCWRHAASEGVKKGRTCLPFPMPGKDNYSNGGEDATAEAEAGSAVKLGSEAASDAALLAAAPSFAFALCPPLRSVFPDLEGDASMSIDADADEGAAVSEAGSGSDGAAKATAAHRDASKATMFFDILLFLLVGGTAILANQTYNTAPFVALDHLFPYFWKLFSFSEIWLLHSSILRAIRPLMPRPTHPATGPASRGGWPAKSGQSHCAPGARWAGRRPPSCAVPGGSCLPRA